MPVNKRFRLTIVCAAALAGATAQTPQVLREYDRRVAEVTRTPGCVALWDFVRREAGGQRRFTAHVPPGSASDFALDAANYVRDYWGEGPKASYADFPLQGRGPFGQAIRLRAETDPAFRPLLLVPRESLHGSALDIKGPHASVSMVAWVIRESGEHAIAGIWHEGTDLKQHAAAVRVEPGARQYALFAGLSKPGGVLAHLSENGGASFLDIYAHHKATTAARMPAVPTDAPQEVLDRSWQVMAFTFDNARDEMVAYLNGEADDHWEDLRSNRKWLYHAWLQAELSRKPGLQPGEHPNFPPEQMYFPPEGEPLKVEVVRNSESERVELREFRYTRVQFTLRKNAAGEYVVVDRDLVGVRLNPWWFPYDLYAPAAMERGGPFTIGRVVHSARSVGFTGWIGGVAVFNRALTPDEVKRLAAIGRERPPIRVP